MQFVGIYGTSNARPIDYYARKAFNVHHTWDHPCCTYKRDANNLKENISRIINIEIASYPGLNLRNIRKFQGDRDKSKQCMAGPYEDLTVTEFLSTICVKPDFSGIIASIMLCNDEKLISRHDSPEAKVKSYFEKLEDIYSHVQGFDNVNMIILSTALYRQADFYGPASYRVKKVAFNNALLRVGNCPDTRLTVNNRHINISIIDMDKVVPYHQGKNDMFYCEKERAKRKIHVRGEYMENYLLELKHKVQKYNQKCRRAKGSTRVINPFYMFCKIDIS